MNFAASVVCMPEVVGQGAADAVARQRPRESAQLSRMPEVMGLQELSRSGKVTDQRAARRLNALSLELPHMQMKGSTAQTLLQPVMTMFEQ
eukprot:2959292-Amphidinium_carterae.1